MGLSAKPEFHQRLKILAAKENRLMVEILEEALELYEKKQKTKQSSINLYQLLGVNNNQEIKAFLSNQTLPQIVSRLKTYQQTIQTIEKQIQPFQGNMSWLELKAKTDNLNPTYFNKIGLITTYQILKETLEEFLWITSEKK